MEGGKGVCRHHLAARASRFLIGFNAASVRMRQIRGPLPACAACSAALMDGPGPALARTELQGLEADLVLLELLNDQRSGDQTLVTDS